MQVVRFLNNISLTPGFKKTNLFVCMALLLLGGSASASPTCDCFEILSHRKEFNRSKAVFIGEVVRIETPTLTSGLVEELPEDLRSQAGDRITLKVIKKYKGTSTTQLIWTDATHLLCNKWQFKVGEKYLIYARKFRNILIGAEFCRRTRPLETTDPEKNKELKELDAF
jgi:hypothetical protein